MIECSVTDCAYNNEGTCDDSLYDVRIDWGWYGPTCQNYELREAGDDDE